MRVIGGALRGRRLQAVPRGVRPTSERVRESLFSVLGDVQEARVLDLFAGCGSLGIEAASRGAAEVCFVEKSRRVADQLRRNLVLLGLMPPQRRGRQVNVVPAAGHPELRCASRVELLCGDACRTVAHLGNSGRRFDLVLLDPPYDADLAGRALEALVAGGLLRESGQVVVEAAKRHLVPPVVGLRVLEERHYGDTRLTWLGPSTAASLEPESARSVGVE